MVLGCHISVELYLRQISMYLFDEYVNDAGLDSSSIYSTSSDLYFQFIKSIPSNQFIKN